MSDFVHLHNHTDYSLLDGALKIDDMVNRAVEFGMKSIAITDHGNMFGAINFYNKCRKAGIKPIVGCEFYEAEGSRKIKSGTEFGNKYYHLILLAKDYTGYRNLMKLCSTAYVDGFYYKPRIDMEVLEKYHEGLICSSACIAGSVPRLIINNKQDEALKKAMMYRDLFGKENYFLELQDHGIPEERISNRGLIEISRRTGIPLIATNDIHYLNRENASAQEVLICIGTQKTINDTNRMTFYNNEFYMKSPEEMIRLFADVPEAISNTKLIEEMTDLTINFPGPKLPDFEIPPQFESQTDYMKHIVYEGAKKRYSDLTPDILKRIEYELDTIIKLGFVGYFLIVWDFINYAKEHDIPVGPGRGSGAGSIVAYCMRITDIDPLKYGLLFERFLNMERVSLPDFDVDFANEGRQEVIDYVTRKYGAEKVGQIITFGTLKPKAVIKDVARVLGLSFNDSQEIVNLIPDKADRNMSIASLLGEVAKFREDPEKKEIPELAGIPELIELKNRGGVYERLFNEAKYLENMSRNTSLHAAGIVIGQTELSDYVPLYKGTKDDKANSIATQFTMDKLEDCGLVKMDFLGLKTLDVIKNCEALIRKRKKDFTSEKIPDDDPETFEMLSAGKSTAVFQFESAGMQKILKDAKPTCIEDLIALNALFRPGPMDNIPQFCNCKNGKEKIKYPHIDLEPILKSTYGVIVYQEQVMQVVQKIGGFSLGKADILRRYMSKKKVKEMEQMKDEFIPGAKERGYDEKLATDIFDLLIPFSKYGFNKSHAAAYSVVAYKTAYLKKHYPAEFMAANLTNEIGNPDNFKLYLGEVRTMGIKMLPPNINISDKYFSVDKGQIIYGIQGIKNTGGAVVEEIIHKRNTGGPFKSFCDFLKRVDLRIVNKRVLDSLIKAGLFDSLDKNRAKLAMNADALSDYFSEEQEKEKMGMMSLFGEDDSSMQPPAMEEIPDWDVKERLEYEKERLGFYASGHPMDKYRSEYDKYTTLDMLNLEGAPLGRNYTVIGMVKEIKIFTTKKSHENMASVTLSTFDADLNTVIFPKLWKEIYGNIAEGKVLAFTGKLDKSRDMLQLICEKVQETKELGNHAYNQVHISLNSSFTEENLVSLREFLLDRSGHCSVFLHLNRNTVIKATNQLRVQEDLSVPENSVLSEFVDDIWKE